MDFLVQGIGKKISKPEQDSTKPKELNTSQLDPNTKAEHLAPAKSKKNTTINTTIAENKKKYEESLIKQPPSETKEPPEPAEYYFTSSQPKQFQESKQFETTSDYVNYVPSGNVKELKLEKLWFAIKNRELCAKKEAEEMQKVMEQWGKSKSKYNEEVMRKMECLNEATNFAERSYPIPDKLPAIKEATNYQKLYEEQSESEDTDEEIVNAAHLKRGSVPIAQSQEIEPVTLIDPAIVVKKVPKPKMASPKKAAAAAPMRGKKQAAPKAPMFKPPEFIEIPESKNMADDSIKQNINFIRQLYGPLIKAEDNKMADTESVFMDPEKPICLSMYNKDAMKARPKTTGPIRSAPDALPTILTSLRQEYVAKQYRDIEHLKETFAKADIPCSVITLQNALLMPQTLMPGRMTADCVPEPGSRLISNPSKKKKKKKGKKGKKKSKK